jgi:small-conductance mechanosensitive channel
MKRFLILISLFFMFLSGNCQQNQELRHKNEGASVDRGSPFHRLLERADSTRVADSIEKTGLEKQIARLMNYETKRKRELLEQLRTVRRDDSINRARTRHETDSLRKVTKGYPVVPFKDTLFYIYSRVGSVTPFERAAFITSHVKEAARDFTVSPDSIRVVTGGEYRDIVHGDKIIVTVTPEDALWNDLPQDSLARKCRESIVDEIKNYRESISLRTILTSAGFSLLVVVSFILLLRLSGYLFRRLDRDLIPRVRVPEKWQFFSNYETIQKERQAKILLMVSRIVRYLVYLLLTIITLLFIFNILPQTKPIGVTLLGYIVNPLKTIGYAVVKYIPNLITIIIIYIIFRLIIRLLRFFSVEISKGNLRLPGFYPEWSKPTFIIVRFILLVLMVVFIFPFLPGSSSVVFQGVSVFIGLVISISSTSIIGNLLAGLVITFMRSFRIGDTIKAGENTGVVIEKSAFVTRIRTFKGEFITIPHSNILSSHVINYTVSAEDDSLVLYTTITIGYDVPWQKVHEMMINAALATQNILKDPLPYVLQTSLNDYHVSYQVNAYTRNPELQTQIYSELHRNIQVKFNEAGVEILSPMYNTVRK